MNVTKLYARLLRLYPRAFYDRFSEEMLDVFTQAQRDIPTGRTSSLAFYIREFGGLLASIIRQQQEAHGMFGLRSLLRRRYMPVWLFAFSLLLAAIFSQNYWGYPVVPPPSRISNLATIERISLVKFDADSNISVIPIEHLPSGNIPDFPPSNILSSVPADVQIDRKLDPAFTAMLSAALSRVEIEINGPRMNYPREPVTNADGNGFVTGVQPQDDGSLLVIYPEISHNGRIEVEPFIQHVTPSDSHYYYFYTMPAGYIVQGRDSQGDPLVFTTIANCVGGDRYRYHELTFAYGADGLILQPGSITYNFEIAGMEFFFSLPVVTLFLFIPLLAVWLAILAAAALIKWVIQRQPYRQSIA